MFEVFFKSGLIDLHGWALKVLGVQGGFAKMSDLEGQKTSFQVKNPGFGLKSPFFGQKPSFLYDYLSFCFNIRRWVFVSL